MPVLFADSKESIFIFYIPYVMNCSMSPAINAQILYHFVIFTESTSMQEAADRLGITQPALTKQLQQLDRSFSQRVFSFQGKRKVLTEFGESLRQQLKGRLVDLPEMLEQLGQSLSEPAAARVRVMARREILDRISARVDWPGSLILLEGSHAEILRAIGDRTTDIGITHGVPASSPLIARPLFRESFQFAVPTSLLRKARLASKDSEVEILRALPSLPFVAYRENDEILRSVCEDRGLAIKNLKPHRVTANYWSLAQMIESGLGWGVIPSHYLLSDSHVWTLKIPLKLPVKAQAREFQLLYRRDLKEARWLKDFTRSCSLAFEAEK